MGEKALILNIYLKDSFVGLLFPGPLTCDQAFILFLFQADFRSQKKKKKRLIAAAGYGAARSIHQWLQIPQETKAY